MSEESYRLTAKGLLHLKMEQASKGHETNMDSAWEELVELVKNQSAEDGMTGIPCLVMEKGGICITVEKQKAPKGLLP